MSAGLAVHRRRRDRRSAGRRAPLAAGAASAGPRRSTSDRTRLIGTTENLYWYASEIAELPVPYKVVGGPEIREAVRNLAQRLADAVS